MPCAGLAWLVGILGGRALAEPGTKRFRRRGQAPLGQDLERHGTDRASAANSLPAPPWLRDHPPAEKQPALEGIAVKAREILRNYQPSIKETSELLPIRLTHSMIN